MLKRVKMLNIIKQVESFVPFNEKEAKDKEIILSCLKSFDNIFTRENELAHITVSAWVTNKNRNKILMAYHNIYDSWAWLGGHADGERNLLSVAIREAKEESGVKNVKALSEDIFSLEVLPVEGHIKKGKYVSSHLHLNVTYLLEADEDEKLEIKKDENSAVAWLTFGEVIEKSSEKWFRENIYTKLLDKLHKQI